MTGHLPPPAAHGMTDDTYWSTFTSDAECYELGPAIGLGAYSTVYAGTFHPRSTTVPFPNSDEKPVSSLSIPAASPVASRGAGRECAIKVSSSHPDVEQLFKETKLLTLSRHPNVLRVLATFTLPPDHQRIAIVTPLIGGGSLAGILDWRARLASTPKPGFAKFRLGKKANQDEETGRLDEEEIKSVIKQVLQGLAYLHERGFLHRDLKAGNILVSPDGTVLLADFGVGGDLNEALSPNGGETRRPNVEEMRFDSEPRRVRGSNGTSRRLEVSEYGKRKSFVGTPSWMAPEVIMGQKYDAKADIWSLGITILELAHGSPPGSQDRAKKILTRIINDAAPSLDRSLGFSRQMKEFVDTCLAKDPSQRPPTTQLLDHTWLRGARKKGFLAETLLDNVPAIEQRQEMRRIPTNSSFTSLVSAWDFAASMPNSPNRSSLYPSAVRSHSRSSLHPSTARSPSIASQMYDYFPSPMTGVHSRSSSMIPSLPPSPRIPLRQWAERTASVDATDASSSHLRIRTASEKGSKRSSSRTALRRGQSASVDGLQGPNPDVLGRETPPSSVRQSRYRRAPSMDSVYGEMEHLRVSPTAQMSPLLEASIPQPVFAPGPADRSKSPSSPTPLDLTILSSSPADSTLQETPASDLLHDIPDSAPAPSHAASIHVSNTKIPAWTALSSEPEAGVIEMRRERSRTLSDATMVRTPPASEKQGKTGRKGWLGRKDSLKRNGEERGKKASEGWAAGIVGAISGRKNR